MSAPMNNRSTVIPRDALSRLLAAAKQINADECKDERVFHALQGEIAVAEGVLRDYAEPPSLAYALAVASNYIDTLGGDSTRYRQAIAAQSAVAAASVPEGWRIVEQVTHYALHEGNTVVASLAGPEAEANAAIIARAIVASRAAPLHEAGNAAAVQASLNDGRQDEAHKLARILFGMVEGDGRVEGANIYAEGYIAPDGDVFVLRAAELLIEQAAEAKELTRYVEYFALASRNPAAAPSIAAPTELERDAARYRWLRNPTQDVSLVIDKRGAWVPEDETIPGVGGYHVYEYRAGDELDQAIDAAIATGEKHE